MSGTLRTPQAPPGVLAAGARIVLFAVGTPLAVDVEESCARLGVRIAALLMNRDGTPNALDTERLRHVHNAGTDLAGAAFICPLFTPANRRIAVMEALAAGFVPAPALIDPTAIAPRALVVGRACFINAGAIIGAAGVIGDFVIINRGANIGHHAELGDYVSIGPGAILAGGIRVGAGTTIGAGAVIAPSVRIGANAAVAPGAVVTRDVPDDHLATGNPARLSPRPSGQAKGTN